MSDETKSPEELVDDLMQAAARDRHLDLDETESARVALLSAWEADRSALASSRAEVERLTKALEAAGDECAFHRYDALYAVKALLDAFVGGTTLNVTAAQGEAVSRAREYVAEFGHLEAAVTRDHAAAEARATRAEAEEARLQAMLDVANDKLASIAPRWDALEAERDDARRRLAQVIDAYERHRAGFPLPYEHAQAIVETARAASDPGEDKEGE